MSTINRTIDHLKPNTSDPNNPNSQSSWFSYVRTVYSRERLGTVKPPTKTEFMREWNCCLRRIPCFTFITRGETLEEHKECLEETSLPPFYISHIVSESDRRKKLKIITWTRMIMALNMYADIRAVYGIRPSNRVDFISSMGNDYSRNRWEDQFHGRCVLYIRDEELIQISELIKNGRHVDFWRRIFHIYESQPRNPRFRINRSHATSTRSELDGAAQRLNSAIRNQTPTPSVPATPTPSVPAVDRPTHSIAQEYLNRTDEEDEIDIILDNRHIANMLINTENQLPDELKKIVYETCMALQISCPIVSE